MIFKFLEKTYKEGKSGFLMSEDNYKAIREGQPPFVSRIYAATQEIVDGWQSPASEEQLLLLRGAVLEGLVTREAKSMVRNTRVLDYPDLIETLRRGEEVDMFFYGYFISLPKKGRPIAVEI